MIDYYITLDRIVKRNEIGKLLRQFSKDYRLSLVDDCGDYQREAGLRKFAWDSDMRFDYYMASIGGGEL